MELNYFKGRSLMQAIAYAIGIQIKGASIDGGDLDNEKITSITVTFRPTVEQMKLIGEFLSGARIDPVKPTGQAWLPIEEAPQNSVDVLVCMNNFRGEILVARTPGNGEWFDRHLLKVGLPTHYMPLPEKPTYRPPQPT